MSTARALRKKTTPAGSAVEGYKNNSLLAALPDKDAQALLARCELVDLPFGAALAEPGAEIQHVYFPTGSFVSLISWTDRRTRLEVGLVGTEGMIGVALLMGVKVEPLGALVQGAGPALRITAAHFSSELRRSAALRHILNLYLYVHMSQLMQMPACTSFHVLEARFARRLLMTRDCAHSNEFQVTQEFMARMLGVRRVGVTHAAGALQKRKLISYSRGKVTILNSARLEDVACACYAASKGIYAAMIVTRDA